MRLLVVAALILSSTSAFAVDCAHHADRSFHVERADIKTLAVKLGSTDMKVRGVDGLARIEVQARACASNAGDLERLTVEQRRDGDRLVIETERNNDSWSLSLFGSSYAYLELEIRVPRDLPLEVNSGSGDVDARELASLDYTAGSGDLDVTDIAGELTVETGSGDVEGSGLGRLHLRSTGSGDFNLRDIRGDVEVGDVGSGDLDLRKVAGSIQVDQVGSGDLDFSEVGGDVGIDSIGSGDVSVEDVRGNLTVKSAGSSDINHRNVGGKVGYAVATNVLNVGGKVDVPESD